ncbi:methyltransferase domain-containing protein [Agromyces agglutinans]|uniref:methyltransferase domain-containing protein n=1 Tax=Agromyces agglutinans TaxID=2662258 RepID=UPI0028A7B161|nr:methyltransferase domain-containing protein [Agromyces agglutinans]
MGDDREMLEARAGLLGSGAYAPIAAAVAANVAAVGVSSTAAPAAESGLSLVDFGCGTGYYSQHVAETLPVTRVLLTDRSPEAVRASLTAFRGLVPATGVVLDIWRPLPIRDAVADAALVVFAPRNPPEYARALRVGGVLVVVVPTTAHLAELRADAALLEVPEGKDADVVDRMAPHGLELTARQRVEYRLHADETTRALLADMGPSAHHRFDAAGDDAKPDVRRTRPESGAGATDSTTVSVDVLAFTRR